MESIAPYAPKIHVDQNAPGPLKRALYLLAMETVRAQHALEGRRGREYAANLHKETDAIFGTVRMQPGQESRRVAITWGQDTARGAELAKLAM